MRIFERTASAITLDRDGLAQSQSPGGAVDLTLDGVGISGGFATFTPPRPAAIFSAANIAARVFTVYGTDRKDTPITDTVTGVNNSTVETNKIFKTVTRIAVDAATGAAVEAGWTATSYTSWMHLGNLSDTYTWKLRVFLAGTADWDLEATSQNMNRDQVHGDYPDDLVSVLAAQTGNVTSDNDTPWSAIRLKVNSQSADVVMRAMLSISG